MYVTNMSILTWLPLRNFSIPVHWFTKFPSIWKVSPKHQQSKPTTVPVHRTGVVQSPSMNNWSCTKELISWNVQLSLLYLTHPPLNISSVIRSTGSSKYCGIHNLFTSRATSSNWLGNESCKIDESPRNYIFKSYILNFNSNTLKKMHLNGLIQT